MRKTIITIAALITILVAPSLAYAQNEAGSSALLKHPLISTPALKIEPQAPSTETYELKKKDYQSTA